MSVIRTTALGVKYPFAFYYLCSSNARVQSTNRARHMSSCVKLSQGLHYMSASSKAAKELARLCLCVG